MNYRNPIILLLLFCMTSLCSCKKMGPINEVRAKGKYKGTFTYYTATYVQGVWIPSRTSREMEIVVSFKKGDVVISSYGMLSYDGDKKYISTINGTTTAVFDPGDSSVEISQSPPYGGLGAPPSGSIFVGKKL